MCLSSHGVTLSNSHTCRPFEPCLDVVCTATDRSIQDCKKCDTNNCGVYKFVKVIIEIIRIEVYLVSFRFWNIDKCYDFLQIIIIGKLLTEVNLLQQ